MEEVMDGNDPEFDAAGSIGAPALRKVVSDIAAQRRRQDADLGLFLDFSDGTCGRALYGPTLSRENEAARESRRKVFDARRSGKLTWRHLLENEMFEVFTESEPAKLRAALVSLAAWAISWIEAIDRRKDEKRIERKMRGSWWQRLKAWFR